MPSKRLFWSVAVILLLVGLCAFAPGEPGPMQTVEDVYRTADGSTVVVAGEVDYLEPADGWANFVVRDHTSQIHVYWPFGGADSAWLRDGACVTVAGQYQLAHPRHSWEPQIQATSVLEASAACQRRDTATWELVSYGGTEYVSGSCHLVRTATHGFLVDCGSYMNTDDMPVDVQAKHRDDESLPIGLGGVGAIVITHAHADHVGRLHYLVYQGYSGPVHMTEATAAIYMEQLPDLLRYSEIPEGERNRTEGRLRAMIRTHTYLEPFEVCEGAAAIFVDAGHIPGSASVVISLDSGGASSVVTFSGDLGSGHHPFLDPPDLVTLSKTATRTVVVESTYGADGERNYPTDDTDLYKSFWQILRIAKESGDLVIIPTFALDRTQRVVTAILEGEHRVDETGSPYLPELHIAVGGKSSCELTHAYQGLQNDATLCARYFSDPFCDAAPLDPTEWTYLRDDCCCGDEYTQVDYRAFDVIVTPSGTGSGSDDATTLSHELLKEFIDEPNVVIIKVGWAPEWTPMGQLEEGKSAPIVVDGKTIPVRATIRSLHDIFSGHADVAKLVEYVQAFPELERVLIVHGDDSRGARQGLERALLGSAGWSTSAVILRPHEGEVVPLD